MGAYGSVPVMDIESEADANDFITYCSSSVQGWRISQEDAHLNKMLIDPDTKASLFGVFDGHGGAEVAKYTAAKLLEVLKENEHFKKDSINIAKALKESFLKLDSQIADPNNKTALEEFLSDEDESDDDEEEVAALFDEADQPIDKLIEKYGGEENIPAETKELLNKRRQSQPVKKEDTAEETEEDKEEEDAKKDMSSVSLKEEQFKKEEQEAIANGDEKKEEENGDKEAEKAEGEEDDDEDDSEDYSEDCDDSDDSSGDSDLDADEVRRMLSEEPSPGFSSGTTACVCLVVPDKKTNKVRLVTANAGDSRAVLCRNGKYVDLSLDHKPEAEIELARIKAAGGTVNSEGRVCGGLNLSRAIGDHNYKKREDLGLAEQIITANPDISEVELDPKTDKFVVIACDGIWNSLTSQEVVDFINARLDDTSLLRKCRKEIPTADDDSTEEESSEDEEADEESGEKKTEETNGKSPEKKKEEEVKSEEKTEEKKEKNGDSANGSKADVKKEDEEEKPLPTDQAGILKEICEDLFHHVLAEKTSMDSVGCDNMTCSIVMLNNLEAYSKKAGVELEDISTSLPDQSVNTTDIPCKKRKLPESDIEESDAKKVKSC